MCLMSESKERKLKIKECLSQIEEIQAEVMRERKSTGEWRDMAEKSISQKLAVLRLWQGEERMLNNRKIAFLSVISALGGFALSLALKWLF